MFKKQPEMRIEEAFFVFLLKKTHTHTSPNRERRRCEMDMDEI